MPYVTSRQTLDVKSMTLYSTVTPGISKSKVDDLDSTQAFQAGKDSLTFIPFA